MVMDETVLRYAHSEGQTTVSYDDTGRYLITCGCDGDIRIWDGFEDDDPKTHHMGETVTSLAFKDGSVYLSTDANAVMVYNFPSIESGGVIAQFFSDVYTISPSPSGKYIVSGGGDFIVKVYNTETKQLTTCRGHDAPILNAVVDPEEKYLASSSCDGTVKIWAMENQTCLETLRLFKKSNDLCNSETLCHLQWYPKGGKFLVIPVQSELKIFERESWTCTRTFKDENLNEIFSIAAFSPCGSFVAGGANNGTVIAWDMKRGTCVFRKEHPRGLKVCSLVWNPSNKKELAFCDNEGQLGVYSNIISDEQTAKIKPKVDVSKSDGIDQLDLERIEKAFDSDFPETDDVDDIMNDFNTESMDGSENAFDIGAIKAKLEPVIFGSGKDDDAVSTVSVPVEEKPKEPVVPITPLQMSFQPSSTPQHLEQRFMLWNTTGIVRCYNNEEENSIDVEFHDASVYHPVHVNNIHGFTMASLSAEALLLASPKGDDGAPSKLQCLHIGTWDNNKEWTIDLPEGEEIEAIALGSGWAAAATDARLLRLFTVSGIQCEVFCIPGPVVCLAGQEKQLAIIYHKGPGIPEEQNLGLMYVKIDLKCRSLCKEYPMPITSKSYLCWLGFTDEGHLCSVDTSSVVRILNATYAAKWTPVSNMKSHAKGKSDNYFVVGLSEIQQEIRCIPCKGSRYPAVLPRPAVSVLPFNLPFCETATDKGRLEEEQSRCVMTYNRIKSLLTVGFDLSSELAAVEKKWTDNLLKMFALATRTDREYRALDIAELMPNPKVVEGAIRYATQRHRMAMAERLGEIMYKKMTEDVQESGGIEEEDDDAVHSMEVVPSNLPFRSAYSEKDDEEKIQPKPLLGRRVSVQLTSNSSFEDSQEASRSNEHVNKETEISLLPKTNQTMNPFKVQLKAKCEASSDKQPNGGIDDMLFKTTKRLSSKGTSNSTHEETKKQGPKQTKLNLHGPKKANKQVEKSIPVPEGDSDSNDFVKPKKTGFALFLEECKDELKKQHPDETEQEIVKIAMKAFKDLPAEEKARYKNKPKSKDTTPESEASKRKSANEEVVSPEQQSKKSKKVETTSNGNIKNKFSAFAFSKKSSD